MFTKFLKGFVVTIFLLGLSCTAGFAQERGNKDAVSSTFPIGYPVFRREMLVMQDMRTIANAQATYQATVGAGAYGSLAALHITELINADLASGDYRGYSFTLTAISPIATLPARFFLTATPQHFPLGGRRSFYIDETGVIRGANKNGEPATSNDPPIDF